ncbi:hypothetical protein [Ferruginibacter sp. SUN106]|uniref:hypothetical protein n=1 Tax=Ferruginibacter sp. SUN106 TaxID=2978348 RepID=UPI003D36900B
MKKLLFSLLFSLLAMVSLSQHQGYDKIRRDYPGRDNREIREAKIAELDKQYRITIGTSKLKASYDPDGIELKDADLRLVGLLFRGGKLDVDELYIVIRKDGAVVDSLTTSCRSNAKWKDFYFHLDNVVQGDNYKIDVYSNKDRVFLGSKNFYLRKPKE